jgi:hypothetical protein
MNTHELVFSIRSLHRLDCSTCAFWTLQHTNLRQHPPGTIRGAILRLFVSARTLHPCRRSSTRLHALKKYCFYFRHSVSRSSRTLTWENAFLVQYSHEGQQPSYSILPTHELFQVTCTQVIPAYSTCGDVVWKTSTLPLFRVFNTSRKCVCLHNSMCTRLVRGSYSCISIQYVN